LIAAAAPAISGLARQIFIFGPETGGSEAIGKSNQQYDEQRASDLDDDCGL
jgi:hypothetical protein